jgi:hypothetical protein
MRGCMIPGTVRPAIWSTQDAVLYEVAKVLGHSQLKTTKRYAHLSQETLLEAVDAAAKASGTNWKQAQTEKTL